MITGHKDGIVCFWTLKESGAWKSWAQKGVNRDELLIGKFGHLYDRSLYVNKAVKLSEIMLAQKLSLNKMNQKGDLKITAMTLSYDQTKLFVALEKGDILCFK